MSHDDRHSPDLDHYDLLLRASWATMPTAERWLLLRTLRRDLERLHMPQLPHELEDAFWDAIREIMRFIANSRIASYLMHPQKGADRRMNLLEGIEDPDEWILNTDEDPGFEIGGLATEIDWVTLDVITDTM